MSLSRRPTVKIYPYTISAPLLRIHQFCVVTPLSRVQTSVGVYTNSRALQAHGRVHAMGTQYGCTCTWRVWMWKRENISGYFSSIGLIKVLCPWLCKLFIFLSMLSCTMIKLYFLWRIFADHHKLLLSFLFNKLENYYDIGCIADIKVLLEW